MSDLIINLFENNSNISFTIDEIFHQVLNNQLNLDINKDDIIHTVNKELSNKLNIDSSFKYSLRIFDIEDSFQKLFEMNFRGILFIGLVKQCSSRDPYISTDQSL